MIRQRGLLPAALIGLVSLPELAAAQAWLPGKGDFSFGVTYADVFNKDHYLPDGSELDVGHTRSHTVGLGMVYGLTERLTVTAGIPYVRAEYHGPRPHPTQVDDGRYHGTFTDWHAELHYQAMVVPFALAPYVGVVIPSTDYETLGHAAPGRGLTEYWVGFFAGKSLDAWLPATYAQFRYNYAFVEKVAGIAHDRSSADLEIGYFLNPDWSVRALVSAQEAHGGIDVPIPPTHPLFDFHDRLADESFVNAGIGLSWSFNSRTDIFAIYLTGLQGKNGHKLNSGLNLGFSFGVH
jgi:hypothetical protein